MNSVNRSVRVRLLSLLLVAWWASPAFGQTFTFTDDPLVSGVTPIRAVHLEELRAAINTLRVDHGLSAASFTDAAIGAGATNVRALWYTISGTQHTVSITTPCSALLPFLPGVVGDTERHSQTGSHRRAPRDRDPRPDGPPQLRFGSTDHGDGYDRERRLMLAGSDH